MVWLVILFELCVGVVVGSFINCLVYRLNHGVSILKSRSFCPKCKQKIAWRDNIPVVSFLLLRGRCRSCHSSIFWQYPIVELTAGLLTVFTVSYLVSTSSNLLLIAYYLLLSYCLLAIFVSDLVYMTIPDEVVIFGVFVSLLFLISLSPNILISNLVSAASASLFFYLLYKITKGRGMGFGDVKLAALIGLILGWPKIVVGLYLAFLTGALVGVILILAKVKKFGQQIAFGPFLAAAAWAAMLWGNQIFDYYRQILLK